MQQHICVKDDEQERSKPEEAEQRQFNVQERKLDRVLEEQVLVRDSGSGDEKIEE
jgi:hypothetical protein